MTFQPPPPPPPTGPPPSGPPSGPPGQWGPPPGQPARPGGGFDPKSVNQLDWGIMGAGVLAFIFSLFSYYTASYSAEGFSDSASVSAWHGFFGWFAAILAVIGSAAIALELFQPNVKLPFPNRLVALAAYAVATLSVLLALLVIPDGGAGDIPGVDTGHGFGYWVSLIVIIAGLVLSYMRFTQTGGKLPIGGAKGTAGPPPGYGPPPQG